MADWAGLHLDILVSILQKVRLIEDLVTFGSVCKAWRNAATNNHYLRPQIPWLMLSDRENHCLIYRLSKDDVLRKNLYIPEMSYRMCIGLNYGWVLTVSRKGEMNLVHPLSRSQIQLPNEKSIENWEEIETRSYFYIFTPCAALSANPSQTSDFAVMIVDGGEVLYLSYGRQGDKRWTLIANQSPKKSYSDLTYYQDRFYCVEYNGKVWSFSVSDPQNCVLVNDLSFFTKAYIVGSEGDLLVVVREYDTPLEFKVYKLDLINGGHKRIKSLGDRAIFVEHSTSYSVHVSEFRGRLIKSSHIYFTEYNIRNSTNDLASYSLEDGQFTQFEVPWSLRKSRNSEPVWYMPSM